jgi:hypothetical protein
VSLPLALAGHEGTIGRSRSGRRGSGLGRGIARHEVKESGQGGTVRSGKHAGGVQVRQRHVEGTVAAPGRGEVVPLVRRANALGVQVVAVRALSALLARRVRVSDGRRELPKRRQHARAREARQLGIRQPSRHSRPPGSTVRIVDEVAQHAGDRMPLAAGGVHLQQQVQRVRPVAVHQEAVLHAVGGQPLRAPGHGAAAVCKAKAVPARSLHVAAALRVEGDVAVLLVGGVCRRPRSPVHGAVRCAGKALAERERRRGARERAPTPTTAPAIAIAAIAAIAIAIRRGR